MGLFAAGGCTATLSDGALGHGSDGLGGEASTSTGGGGPGSGGAAADDAHLRDISRLTRIEYRETVASALGVTPDVKLVPEDGRIAHFTSNVGVTPDPVHPYLLVAEELATDLVPDVLPACTPTDSSTCFDANFRTPLERLFRRQISTAEGTSWQMVMTNVIEAGGDDVLATRSMLAAALLSPDFLFRSSASNAGENAWARRAADWISFALWDAPPDEELGSATSAETALAASLAQQAQRLATDERAVATFARFLGQWLEVDTDLRQDEDDAFTTSPDYLELVAFVREAVSRGTPVTDFVGGSWGMVHPDHAELYGTGGDEEEVIRVDWPVGSLRRGLLGQELFAGSTRHPDQGRRPIFRGLLVRRNLLCDRIQAPDAALVALAGEVEDRTVDTRCASCHRAIDPIGAAFAALDPDAEDPSLEATLIGHDELEGTYTDVAELLEAVAESRSFAECFSRQWLAFFLEQETVDVSPSWVSALADSVQDGASLADIVEQTAFELAVRSESSLPWCEGE